MPTRLISYEFEIGQILYLRTDVKQLPRQVLQYKVGKSETILYEMGCGVESSDHYAYELSTDVDLVLKTSYDSSDE
jgi:hypothetical protein